MSSEPVTPFWIVRLCYTFRLYLEPASSQSSAISQIKVADSKSSVFSQTSTLAPLPLTVIAEGFLDVLEYLCELGHLASWGGWGVEGGINSIMIYKYEHPVIRGLWSKYNSKCGHVLSLWSQKAPAPCVCARVCHAKCWQRALSNRL